MFQPSKQTLAMLEDIERRIDPAVEEDFNEQWRRFLNGEFEGERFRPCRKATSAPGFAYPKI